MNDIDGTHIGGKYRLIKKIGNGSFGEVFLDVGLRRSHLHNEARLYKRLRGIKGIPMMHWFGTEGDYNIMVMELLGPSLEFLFKKCDRHFSTATISRIRSLHRMGFLHRDIKPDNFVVGTGTSQNLIYILDFGLAKAFIDPSTNRHIPYRDGKLLTGTAKFVSINTHLGMEQSRRDDLEGLAYVFLYFMKGDLPWHGIRAENKAERYNKIMECKMSLTVEQLCHGIPAVFSKYLYYCRSLRFDETPDYSFLKDLFKEHYYRKEYDKGFQFDWNALSVDGSECRHESGEISFQKGIVKFIQGLSKGSDKQCGTNQKAKGPEEDFTHKQSIGPAGFVPSVMKNYRLKEIVEEELEEESCNLKLEDIVEDISCLDNSIPDENCVGPSIRVPRTTVIKKFKKWGRPRTPSPSRQLETGKKQEELAPFKNMLKSPAPFRSQCTLQSTANTHG